MILCFIADGRNIHTQRWVEYFAHSGNEVHLITYDPMPRDIPGVREHVISSRWKNLYLSYIPRNIAIQKLVRRIKPDLVHAHFVVKYGFHLVGLNVHPSVVSAWGTDILSEKQSRLIHNYIKKVLTDVDLVYAASHNIGDRIIADYNIPADKIHYHPFGVDTDLFIPQPDKQKSNRITIEIFSNRGFFPVYDNETLVRGFALAYQRNSNLRLTLIGEGPDEQKVRDLVTTLGISDIVSFKKRSDHCDVPKDLQNADIFVTTSLSDGTPVSLLEAMASGLPCIATKVGGIPEWIEDKKSGLLISPDSPEQLAEKILLLAQNPQYRSSLGDAAREKIKKDGQWNTLMVQAEKDYQALIKTYREDKL